VPINIYKKGIRVFGISESFNKKKDKKSTLTGIVMRADRILDGIVSATVKIGGNEATEVILKMYQKLNRTDINLLFLNGCIISWYNIIDLNKIAEGIKRPLICVTYHPSNGLEKSILKKFPIDGKKRVDLYHSLGPRYPIKIKTGYTLYIRMINLTIDEARVLLNKFTLSGAIPEPLRIAKLISRTISKIN
jgi:endonuclease V-like protein UPF0215 family